MYGSQPTSKKNCSVI